MTILNLILVSQKSLRNIIRLGFAAGTIAFSWYLGNKIGYLPPLNYFIESGIADPVLVDSGIDLLNYDRPLTQLLTVDSDRTEVSILIEKSLKRLTLYYNKQPIKSYPMVLGGNPVGDKRQEGDYKTPEGIFKVRDLYPHTQWSKFIWLDYPNAQSWEKHLEAKKQGTIPVSATIGGEIGIHGVPQGSDYLIDEGTNWTWGCISLKNQDVDEIYGWLQVGTVIEVTP